MRVCVGVCCCWWWWFVVVVVVGDVSRDGRDKLGDDLFIDGSTGVRVDTEEFNVLDGGNDEESFSGFDINLLDKSILSIDGQLGDGFQIGIEVEGALAIGQRFEGDDKFVGLVGVSLRNIPVRLNFLQPVQIFFRWVRTRCVTEPIHVDRFLGIERPGLCDVGVIHNQVRILASFDDE